jgi:SAM-dependent methyltransferase
MPVAEALTSRFQQASERIDRARAEFNFTSIQAHVPPGSHVLDVGAWNCYLDELLHDRCGCQVLGLDVVDANKTDMPFEVFDGQMLPVEPESSDVVLLLYVLHHAANDGRLLVEAYRALRPGGLLLVAEDRVDGLWNRIVTVGFHLWLKLVTGMGVAGTFRTIDCWEQRFQNAGFRLRRTISLGHHLGRRLWPMNVLFVLEKR